MRLRLTHEIKQCQPQSLMQHRRLRMQLEHTTCQHCGWRVNDLEAHLAVCPMNIRVECPSCKNMVSESDLEEHRRGCRAGFRVRRMPRANRTTVRQPQVIADISRSQPPQNFLSNVRIEGFRPELVNQQLEHRLMDELVRMVTQSLARKNPVIDKKTFKDKFDKSLPAFKALNSKGDCSICLCEMKAKTMVRKLKCKHHFHKECLDQWLEHKQQCPYCRAVVKVN